VLGHGGLTLQKVQRQSGCKVEIHDGLGNLNGAHPDVNSPELHALILADSMVRGCGAAAALGRILQRWSGGRPAAASFPRVTTAAHSGRHLSAGPAW
jgi:hypothetical protein